MDADNSENLDVSDQQSSSREGEFVDFAVRLTVSTLEIIPSFTDEHCCLNINRKVVSKSLLDLRIICKDRT